MVSRIGPDSGSRRTFQDKVINGSELGITSDDCERKDDPAAGYHRCEVGDTRALLEKVDRIDGAIGYAELGMSRKYSRVRPVSIDKKEPLVGNITNDSYRFCAREYAYTYREPPGDGSLPAGFLSYLNTEIGSNILREGSLIPARDVPDTMCG